MHYLRIFVTLLIIPFVSVFCDEWCDDNDSQNELMRNIMIANYWTQQANDRLPVTYNYLLQGGYLVMPSARMGEEGELSLGAAFVRPYRIYSGRCQFLSNFEITGNYRVFSDIPDPLFGSWGFGDKSDKGANFKLAIFHPEDSAYQLPGLAIGMDDVYGTRAFPSTYVVLTKVYLEQNFELSFGYGNHRINRWFGGAAWMPFRKSCYPLLQNLSLVAEYDATDYKNDPHPLGRSQKSHFNAGIKYRLFDFLDLSVSSLKGEKIAGSISAFYNFGTTQGFVPKIDDPTPYRAPINTHPLGFLRTEEVLVHDFLYALKKQGFTLLEAWIECDECGKKNLRLKIYNEKYFLECQVREHLNCILANLTPMDVDQVIVVIEDYGFTIHQYRYRMEYLRKFSENRMCQFELDLLSPRSDVTTANPYCSTLLFQRNKDLIVFDLKPKTETLFGSARGKFKYAAGISAGFNGYFWDNIYYSLALGIMPFNNLQHCNDFDALNPSQLINVRTSVVRYYQRKNITLDEGYLQKNCNMSKGWFSRLALGYFDCEYGGVGGEILYYPANSCWGIGLEGAILKRRSLHGLGFRNTIRKLNGFTPTYVHFLGSQYFMDLYYSWKEARLDFKVSIGKFLANDWGATYSASRYFESGMRIYLWYSTTNAHDIINGKVYYDTGIGFSMPLDIFLTHSSRTMWGTSMSAWLRDSAYKAPTGKELYEIIDSNRQ